MSNPPINILLVEDNEGDILLTTEAFLDCKVANELKVLNGGSEALHFLLTQSRQSLNELSDLILLDINLPKKSGMICSKVLKIILI